MAGTNFICLLLHAQGDRVSLVKQHSVFTHSICAHEERFTIAWPNLHVHPVGNINHFNPLGAHQCDDHTLQMPPAVNPGCFHLLLQAS